MHTSQAEGLLGPPVLQAHQIPRKPIAASQEPSAQAADSYDNVSKPSTEPKKLRHQKFSQKHSHFTWNSLDTWWGFEIAALVLAFASFVALILILQRWDKRPQQQWSYSHLTLNGLVAILSTVTRASLLVPVAGAISQAKWTWFSTPRGRALESFEVIDQSSRGAWGSLRLLWHTRCYHLMSIGALITILALAFDTFSQQVITIGFRNVEDPTYKNLANVLRSQSITVENAVNEFPIKAAIANGIYNSDISDLTAYCPTGNCTWPRIPTLGMCGGCTNVTDALKKTCQAGGPGYQACNYTLPSGTFFTYSWLDGNGPNSGGFEDYFVSSATNGRVYNGSDPSASIPFTFPHGGGVGGLSTVPVYTAHFEAIYQANSGDNPSNSISAISATECALWFCIQAYDISTTLGIQTQTLNASWTTVLYPPGGGWDTLPFANIPADFNIVPANTTYSLSYLQLQSVIQSFSWNQSINRTVSEMDSEGSILTVSSDLATSMWDGSGNWTHWIDKLSRSLTNTIRTTWPVSNSTDSKYYAGQVSNTQSYVHVRWAWLAFPAAMLLASLVFLLASMWQTYRSNTHAWKDSALVLLSVALDPDILDNAHAYLNQPGELERQIGEEKVVLEKRDGGLELRRVV
jgi:hypothetical protein